MYLDLVKIFIPTATAFFLGLVLTPFATHFFYKHKMWKKYSRSSGSSGDFQKIHNEKEELHTPRIGGIIIWLSVLLSTILFSIFASVSTHSLLDKLNFLSRNQTLIPFFTLLLGALIGLWDDLLQIYGTGAFARDDKSWRKWKAFLVAIMSVLIGCWFFYKLGMDSIHIPFGGDLYLGFLIIPFFVLVALATFSGGVIDGIDGLSGGVFASMFSSYSAIAFANNQIDLATFSGVIAGAILAFLWFNIPPARFYMGETGIMGLTLTLATFAFITDTVFILPIVAMPLVITSLSVILQMSSKKWRNGKRVFRLAPIHHHFEAIGWSTEKITMRYWVLSVIFSIIGIVLSIVSR
jgi:phospho-N-acetylmuramoyl-pentapeptide-transferase